MNLLFTINNGFYHQLTTTLMSIRLNTYADRFDIYMIHNEEFTKDDKLARFCQQLGMNYHPITIKNDAFKDAPVSDRYPATIYYRLLAHHYLPDDLDRILYLDADILCINDLSTLYETDLTDYLYASSIHSSLTDMTDTINKIRLQNFDATGYYNSGVLLMNLPAIRETVKEADIYKYIEDHVLLLPDQDVLNALYGNQIKAMPDQKYNLDSRNLRTYETISFGEWTLDWIMANTVLIHYCGRDKPWLKNKNNGRLTALYKHYWNIAGRAH